MAQRLSEARASAFPARASTSPDGAPAPIPGMLAAGGVARVTQRFTGVGVAPRTQAQREERRARIFTLFLAFLAIGLIVSSALLLFNPFVLKLSFGFNPGQRVTEVHSKVPLIITKVQQSTPTPKPSPKVTPRPATPQPGPKSTATAAATGTPRGGPGPTATAAPSPLPTATATPAPTATATPAPTATPSPTPTATPAPGAVTVTFTAASQTISSNSSNDVATACPSGCDIPVTTGSASSGTYAGSLIQATGGYTYQALDLWVQNTSGSSKYVAANLPGCGSSAAVTVPANSNVYLQCAYPSSSNVNGYTDSGTVHYYPASGLYTDYSNTYITSTDCTNAKNSAINAGAQTWANNYPAPPQGIVTSRTATASNCNPTTGTYEWQVYGNGQHNNPLKTSATATGHVNYETFTYSQAEAWVAAQLPLTSSNWAWKSGSITGCSPQSYSSGGGNVITVVCGVSELEYFNWSSSEKAQIASALAGQQTSNGSSICDSVRQSVEGVAPTGTCTVSSSGASVLPGASQITVVVNVP